MGLEYAITIINSVIQIETETKLLYHIYVLYTHTYVYLFQLCLSVISYILVAFINSSWSHLYQFYNKCISFDQISFCMHDF